MNFLRKYKFLILILALITVTIATVYVLIDDTSSEALTLPDNISSYAYEILMLARIIDFKDKDFVMGLYYKVPSSDKYRLRESITSQDVTRLKAILQKYGYYLDLESVDRDIHTPAKVVLNGYLGQFFRFKLVGVTNWLFIPAFIFYFFISKKINRNHKVIFLSVLICMVAIVIHGYNYRYQLTFLPFISIVAWFFINEVLRMLGCEKYRVIVFIYLILLMIFNDIKYIGVLVNESSRIQSTILTPMVDRLASRDAKSGKVRMASYIENIKVKPGDKFLVNNLPSFYYYTNKSGVYYWSYGDNLFYVPRMGSLLYGHTLDEVYSVVYNELGCRYVLSSNYFNSYNPQFLEFLNKYATPIYQDEDYILYKISDLKR